MQFFMQFRSVPSLRRACVFLVLLVAAGIASGQQRKPDPSDLALVGGKVYASPTAAPIDDAAVLVHDGKILAIGKRREIAIPDSDQIIDCSGKVITAGFWNSHVHFTEDAWNDAAGAPADKLEQHMQEMLTRWGFVAVFDLGSLPENTRALKRRIAEGELAGPQIFMAGDIFPKNGIPIYLPKDADLPQAGTPEEARKLALGYMAAGDDAVKLFTGSFQGDKPVINMPEPVAKAAVDVAHAHGKPVFTHPQNRAGQDNALAAGVDVLAHTIPSEGEYTKDELTRMKAQHTALIPTLTLWEFVFESEHAPVQAEQRFVRAGVNELKSYFDEGGTILFGTDVGFTNRYDTTEEYVLMAKSGMTWGDILASLTTNPATFFKAGAGQLVNGNLADLVVLNGDPASDIRNFAKVEYTIRAGKVIYKK
jgi:imidazolonepropionase-like amidohydrolase